jgi:hypothetical protein
MRPEGHMTPFRFLLWSFAGPTSQTFTMPSDTQGIITGFGFGVTSGSGTTQLTFLAAGSIITTEGVTGVPPGLEFGTTAAGLWIPVYGSEDIVVELAGSAGDASSGHLTGILYSVNVAT